MVPACVKFAFKSFQVFFVFLHSRDDEMIPLYEGTCAFITYINMSGSRAESLHYSFSIIPSSVSLRHPSSISTLNTHKMVGDLNTPPRQR